MTSKRCSVVVRAYNEAKHIGRLMEGIRQQTLEDSEIVLVDSGSTDDTAAIAQKYGAKIVRIRPEEFTFGYSLNKGIEAASGEIIVIASAHVYPVYPDWIEQLLVPFGNPQVALVYGKQRGTTTTQFSEHQVFARWFPDVSDFQQGHPFCNNANAAVRRELWARHRYDETLTGLEDLAWAKWTLGQGFHLAYIAEAEIIHVHDEVPHQVYNRYRREAIAFKRIFPEERFTLWNFLRLTTSNTLADCFQALQQRNFRVHWRDIAVFRFNQFWGTYRGYRQAGPVTAQLRDTFYYPGETRLRDESKRDVLPIQYDEYERS